MGRGIYQQQITDDRGETQELLDPMGTSFRITGVLRPAEPEDPTEHAVMLGRRLLRLEDPVNSAALVILPSAFLVGFPSMMILALVLPRWLPAASAIAVVGGLAGAIVGVLIGVRVLARALDRLRRRLATLPPVCLTCKYQLSGLHPEPDGCTVCPECGAAWRLPPRPEG